VLHTFQELVLSYPKEQFDAWKRGDRSVIPAFHEVPDKVRNQQAKGMGHNFIEFFVLNYFHRTEGWKGHRYFVLGRLEDMKHAHYARGGEQIAKTISPNRLAAFRKARSLDPKERIHAKGEPDLFLYKETGERMFLEVKRSTDKLDRDNYQLRCLAQIRSILDCRAEIVHVREENERYTPRAHTIEFEAVPPPSAQPVVIRRPAK
jgi:hypothetical protein